MYKAILNGDWQEMSLDKNSNVYIIGFAAAICVVCSIFVSGAAVTLRPQQKANAKLDLQKNVVSVSGLTAKGDDAQSIMALFEPDDPKTPDRIQTRYINLTDGIIKDFKNEEDEKELKKRA